MNIYYELKYDFQYPNDNLSGPGYTWKTKREFSQNFGELQEELRVLLQENGKERSRWENSDTKWRGKYTPHYRNLSLSKITADPIDFDMRIPEQFGYDQAQAESEARRDAWQAENDAKDLAEYKRLQAKYRAES